MTTFSRLVDDIVTELLRPDLRSTVATYANQTIREMHFRPNLNVPIMYDANRYEDVLTITSDGMWSWPIPSSTRYQDTEAIFIDDVGRYWQPRNPRVSLESSFEPNAHEYYYRSGPNLILSGVSGGWTGKISYHMFPRVLGYKTNAERLIKFDPDTDSYVLVSGGEPSEAQLELETHWILQRWADTVKQGVRAKAWGRLGEMDRSKLAFSAFESMRTAVWNTEASS